MLNFYRRWEYLCLKKVRWSLYSIMIRSTVLIDANLKIGKRIWLSISNNRKKKASLWHIWYRTFNNSNNNSNNNRKNLRFSNLIKFIKEHRFQHQPIIVAVQLPAHLNAQNLFLNLLEEANLDFALKIAKQVAKRPMHHQSSSRQHCDLNLWAT